MRILLLGSTGPTGRHLARLALRAGDSVTALARNPEGLVGLDPETVSAPGQIEVIRGDARSRVDVSHAAAGQDVIISALGRGSDMRPDKLFSEAARATVGAAADHGVTRLVWLSSFGVGATFRQASFTQKSIYRTLLRALYADKQLSESTIRASNLDWTMVYPTRLTNHDARGAFSVAEHLPMKGNPTVSRADVAAFMHQVAHNRAWIRSSPIITD